MITINHPQQNRLFDSYLLVLGESLLTKLQNGWQGTFRHSILKCLPVQDLARHFSSGLGRPTKELYAMAGMLLIKEFHHWTMDQAIEHYQFNMGIHYALNLEPMGQELSRRTLESYQALFIEEDLAARVMQLVTDTLVEELGLTITRQRLDSTHVFSAMAEFGRTRLLATAIRRFLTQLQRHDRAGYDALDAHLLDRYMKSKSWLSFFGAVSPDQTEARHQLCRQVAQDMHDLLVRFGSDANHNQRSTFKHMATIFQQRCEVVDEGIVLREKVGGNVMVNPSDPEATLDGHKGPGYQVQLCETCHPDNEVQLILSAIPQTAVENDQNSLTPVMDDLKSRELLPRELIADTGYGRDENVLAAEAETIELLSPTPGKAGKKLEESDRLRLSEFQIDPATETVWRCPAGHAPLASIYNPQTDCCRTTMKGLICSRCPLKPRCRVHVSLSGEAHFSHYGKERRLEKRRDYEQTEAFALRYRIRSGIESTNAALKRRMGLGRLRVRGQPAVRFAILLRVAGWNLLQASRSKTLRPKTAA